jgi:hypothetical protein
MQARGGSGGGDDTNGDDGAETLATANARNIELHATLSRLTADVERLSAEIGSQL